MAFGIKKLLKKITPADSQDDAKAEEAAPKPSTKKMVETEKPAKSTKQSTTKTEATSEEKAESSSKSPKAKSTKKEEKDMTTENNSATTTTIRHEYVEVAADLLAKPSALCDLVEAQGGKAVLVFCNNPSDTDFVEVILKKRGIAAIKLIGFVAPEKLEKTQEKVRSADLAAVVVTDVAARGLDFSLFSVIVNYSLPSDADVYNIRSAVTQPGDRIAVSIVSPLDFANFHQIKTSTAFEFTKREAPSKEDLAKAKLVKVKNTAIAKGAALDPALSELAKQISKDSESNGIIAYLLQTLFEVVPQLQAQVDKLSWERENLEHEEEMGQEGQGQPFRSGGRDRDSRAGGYEPRGGRGAPRESQGRERGGRGGYDNRGAEGRGDRPDPRDRPVRERIDSGRGRSQPQGGESEGRDFENRDREQRFDDREGSNREENGGRRRRDDRRDDRRAPPPQKIRDDRLYIGKGEKDGLSQQEFTALLKEHCGVEGDQLKRFLLRKNYAFADLPEGLGADVVTKLDGIESKAGKLYVAKATQVVTVIENEAPPAESDGSDSEEGFEGEGEEQPVA